MSVVGLCGKFGKHAKSIQICIYMNVQPIAFGVSFNLNLQSQSPRLSSPERGKRDL